MLTREQKSARKAAQPVLRLRALTGLLYLDPTDQPMSSRNPAVSVPPPSPQQSSRCALPHPAFCMSAGDSNPGPPACAADTSLTKYPLSKFYF